MNKSLLFIFLFLISFSGFSQKMKISGTVYDSTGTIPLENAIAMTVRLRDSVIIEHTRTNEKGEFKLDKTPIDTFTLLISHFRFDDKSYYIFGSNENNEISIPSIRLEIKTKEIQEVTIYANKNPIYFRGDTLVYVADSFKVGQNAVVEDLLKKLPGIKVDQYGNITSQGKEISKVFVDGDEFFGNDPTVATKNLGAKGIETVEVYEKKNENAAEGEDETIQVMNLKLKVEAKKGYFGRVSGATDFTQFYEGELLFNKFNKTQKFSVFLLSSNTPRSNFDWSDIDKFGLDNEGGYRQNDDGDWESTGNSNNGNGIPQTLRSGIYFNDKIGKNKKTEIGFNYSYNNYQLNSLSQSFSQYFLNDTSYYSSDSSRNLAKNQGHSFNLSFLTEFDSLTSLDIKPSFTYSKGTTEKFEYSDFLTTDRISSRTNEIIKTNNTSGKNFNSESELKRKFKKERRELSLEHNMRIGKNESLGHLFYKNLYYLDSITNDTTDQQKINLNESMSQTGRLTYTEPLTKKTKIETEYMLDFSKNSQLKESNNFQNGSYSLLDSTYSNQFENNKLQNRIGLSYIFESRKHSFNVGFRYRNIQIKNNNLFNDIIITQNVYNFLPKASYTYKPSQSTRLHFRYNTSSSQPSVNALQPIPDNSNPNRITIGNPNLVPNYTHSGRINFNTWNAIKNYYFMISIDNQYTNNAFADSTSFDTLGRQYSKTVNVDGNSNFFLNFHSGISFFDKTLDLSPSLNYSYVKSSNFINGERNFRTTDNYSASLGINLNFDSLYISMNGNYYLSKPKSTISNQSNQPYTTQEYSAELEWTLPWWHIKIESDVNYTVNGQRADGYNINYLIWNASIQKAFLKTENLILALEGNDILNQNILAKRQFGANVITDFTTKVISRYFMLKLTYKFNNNKSKEEDENWN